MANFIRYPQVIFREFRADNETLIPLDMVAAAAEITKMVKNLLIPRIPMLDPADVDQLLQHFGLSTANKLIDKLAQDIVDLITGLGGSTQQQVIQAKLRVRTANSCEDYSEIAVADTSILASALQTLGVGLEDVFSLKATLSVRALDGLYYDKYCHETPAYLRFIADYKAWNERYKKYNQRLEEWRKKLKRYVDTHGESEFPTAPTDLPPPWADELQRPPAPPQGREKQREFTIIWSITIEGAAPIGGFTTQPIDFQEGRIVVIGPCCEGH